MAVQKVPISLERDFARIAAPTVERAANDPCLEHARKLPAAELEALLYCILRHYARWITGEVRQMDACIALIGNLCFVRSVPLFEAAELIYSLRDSVSDVQRVESLRAGHAAEENGLDEGAGRFFDLLVFELLKGY